MYGTQAIPVVLSARMRFENDVNMYGTQANLKATLQRKSLRMM